MNLVYRALSRTSALTVVVLWATVPAWSATTRHVWSDSPAPAPPYADWTTAAHVIQDAVDAAEAGDLVLVTNGVYATGGRVVAPATLTNRVAVDKPLHLASVNGPEATIIQGAKAPDGGNGDGAVRCVYLADGASLSGFTLTNGATGIVGAGQESVDGQNDAGGGVWCESTAAVVTNCVMVGNAASNGGGAYQGLLNNCTLTGNSASVRGGGAYECTLNNCTLTGNSAEMGGGASQGTLNNCLLTGNSADDGGGAYQVRLSNCTLAGNSARKLGGGTSCSALNNCIVFFNQAWLEANYSSICSLNYCCTTPLPAGGQGNLSLDPQLASASHLSAGSPCRGAGSADYAKGVDLDGEAWATPPAIGCDEFHAETATGLLSVSIAAAVTNVVVGNPVKLTALIEGWPAASTWEFGDGATAANQPYTAHAWSAPGDYAVVLRAYNESHPQGVSATVTVRVVLVAAVYYVAAANPAPVFPYTSWPTSATNIQDAVDAAAVTGALVLVTNGTYAGRVRVTKPLALQSVNGPGATVITGEGGGGGSGVGCVYLASGASLSGFTVTKGSAGGVYAESVAAVITNCVLTGNSAMYGGGAYGGTLNNCTLTGNSAGWEGGGADRGTLNNCTLTGNSAAHGGGAYGAELNDCTLTGNSAMYGGGAYWGTLNDCTLADNSATYGGGASDSTLNHCTLTGNSADRYGSGTYDSTLNHCTLTRNSGSLRGGGASSGTLNNCTLTGNSAGIGGGADSGTLNNCILYLNEGGDYSGCTLNYCRTTPLPTNGVGNITDEPLFVDAASGNLRLQSNSPCINAGNNAYAPGNTDLDGRPRVVNGTVDMGAYEFQGADSAMFYAWLQHHRLPTDGSADFADPDTDGLNTWQEWRCQTDPTNALSVLRLLSATPAETGVTVSWPGVEGVTYFLERSLELRASPPFSPLATNLSGPTGTHTFTDTNAAASPRGFYRVGVGP